MEQDETWYILHPHPLIYWLDNEFLQNWKYYSAPDPFLETSDGRIWFTINEVNINVLRSGMGWFDPNTNEGCWFTNVRTQVMEDFDHNVWLFTDGYLYKYSLE